LSFFWSEKWISLAIVASLPLLAVRLLYSIVSDFLNDKTFSIFDGNATVLLCIAVIEKLIITIFFLVAGVLATPEKELHRGNEVKVAETNQLSSRVQQL